MAALFAERFARAQSLAAAASTHADRAITDDVRQRRELPVVRFWDFNPKCLMHTDEEVEVVEGINRVVPQ